MGMGNALGAIEPAKPPQRTTSENSNNKLTSPLDSHYLRGFERHSADVFSGIYFLIILLKFPQNFNVPPATSITDIG